MSKKKAQREESYSIINGYLDRIISNEEEVEASMTRLSHLAVNDPELKADYDEIFTLYRQNKARCFEFIELVRNVIQNKDKKSDYLVKEISEEEKR